MTEALLTDKVNRMATSKPTVEQSPPQPVRLTCIGSGDAFGSGGRLQSCYHLQMGTEQILLDCGSSVLSGLERCGLDHDRLSAVVVSHLHGDHFGGIPYLLLAAKYVSQRQQPLILNGPPALQERLEIVLEALYPGVLADGLGFPVVYQTLSAGESHQIGGFRISGYALQHGRGAAFGLRIAAAGKVISYTGDTEWCEGLIPLAADSDLLIAECVAYERALPGHLDYQTLLRRRSDLSCRRLVLTHMGPEMLSHLPELAWEPLSDGSEIVL